ncbi:MAG: caspase family protein, partial [Flavobacteriales bacterium]|nr:caspase family protein [Flavobacteriales bacterium]
MENYIGLFIGVENYQNPDFLKKVVYAQDDATGVRQAFIDLGCFEDRLELVLSERATNATVRAKLKGLCAKALADDVIVMYYAGHGLSTGLGNRITCVDTTKEDLDGSTIGLKEVLSLFETSA